MQCPSTATSNIHMERGLAEQTQEKEILVGDLKSPMVRHMLGHCSGHMVSISSLCARSVEKDEVSLYSIEALILKHGGKTSDVLI